MRPAPEPGDRVRFSLGYVTAMHPLGIAWDGTIVAGGMEACDRGTVVSLDDEVFPGKTIAEVAWDRGVTGHTPVFNLDVTARASTPSDPDLLLPGETIAQAVARINAAVAARVGPFSAHANEPLHHRFARLKAELENNPTTPNRAIAIRSELDAIGPRVEAQLRVAAEFAAHFGWSDLAEGCR